MIIGAIGTCGSGKTYRVQTLVAHALRSGPGWNFLILDVNREWPGEPARGAPRLTFAEVATPMGAQRALKAGHRAVLVRPSIGTVGDHKRDRELADALAYVAISHDAPTALVLPEVHRYAQEGKELPRHLRTIVHQYRHTRTALLFDTQHFADVKKELLREASSWVLYLHAQTHETSLEKLEAFGGRALREACFEAARRIEAARTADDPQGRAGAGWHVRWTPGASAFDLTRGETHAVVPETAAGAELREEAAGGGEPAPERAEGREEEAREEAREEGRP